jgi:peptidoglycan-associated lipoprotein
MRKRMLGFFMVLCCGALLAGGCAKKEMVKSEEAIPSTRPAETTPAKPAVTDESMREQAAKDTSPTRTAIAEPLAESSQALTAVEANLGKVYFNFDEFVLSQSARDTLSKSAEYLLKKNLSNKIQIEGNCDERGSDEYNLALGEKRAKAALNYLVTLGVPAERLSFISYGKEKPADPGHDEAAWAKNRRDDFVVIK